MAKPRFDAHTAMSRAVADHQAGRLEAAEQQYRNVIAQAPALPDAHHLLGVLLAQQGQRAEAIASIRRAIAMRPEIASFHFNLGNVLRDAQQPESAIDAMQRARKCDPALPGLAVNLGNVLASESRHVDAVACFEDALRQRPDDHFALNGLGCSLRRLGSLDEAEAAFRRALQINGANLSVYINLASLLAAGKDKAEARAICQYIRPALANQPEHLREVGLILQGVGSAADAVDTLQAAAMLAPADPRIATGLISAHLAHWDHAAAQAAAEELWNHPALPDECQRAMLMNALYTDQCSPSQSLVQHRAWADRWRADPLPHHQTSPPRLRLGLFSPDLRRHPCARFILPLLRHSARSRYELILYSGTTQPDDLTRECQQLAAGWRNIAGLPSAQIVDLARADQLNVALDLAGLTDGGCPDVFARRIAPTQISWLGYPSTTGVAAMDYRVGDAVTDPPENDPHWSERVLRMTGCFLCYEPAMENPISVDRDETSPGKAGITLGSCNNLDKVTPDVLAHWARIVRAVPGARLYLKARQLSDAAVTARLTAFLRAAGLAPEQICLEGWRAATHYLAAYREIDIALDPFPYNGTTTTCEALSMGVPVITLAGGQHRARVGMSLLHAIGHREWIASSLEAYHSLAVQMAAEVAPLRAARNTLAQQFRASPLMDGATWTEGFFSVIEEAVAGQDNPVRAVENGAKDSVRLDP